MSELWNKPLAESSPLPLWFQVAERLRAAIADGTFGAGQALPSESLLNRTFNISRATSRSALDSLERDGLITRKSGRGSIVLGPRVEQPATEMSGFSDDMRRRGLVPSYRTLFAGKAKAGLEVSQALGLPLHTPLFHSRRVLKADDQPIGLAFSWIPLEVFGAHAAPAAEELGRVSLYQWLAERCGVRIAAAREVIEAGLADEETAERLEMAPAAAVLVVRRRSDAADGTAVEYAALHFRADRYRLHVKTGCPQPE